MNNLLLIELWENFIFYYFVSTFRKYLYKTQN
jgi:hypothetical protein